MRLFKSASRLVFLLLAAGAVAGLFTGHIKEENFMLLATGAFSFYFTKSPTNIDKQTSQEEKESH